MRKIIIAAVILVLVLAAAIGGYAAGRARSSPSTVSCWLINGQRLYAGGPFYVGGTTKVRPERCTVRVENTSPWTPVATDPSGHTFTLYASSNQGRRA